MRTKAIFSLKVASLLIRRGHNLVRRTPNIDNPRYDVFFFEDNQALQNELDLIMKEIKK